MTYLNVILIPHLISYFMFCSHFVVWFYLFNSWDKPSLINAVEFECLVAAEPMNK